LPGQSHPFFQDSIYTIVEARNRHPSKSPALEVEDGRTSLKPAGSVQGFSKHPKQTTRNKTTPQQQSTAKNKGLGVLGWFPHQKNPHHTTTPPTHKQNHSTHPPPPQPQKTPQGFWGWFVGGGGFWGFFGLEIHCNFEKVSRPHFRLPLPFFLPSISRLTVGISKSLLSPSSPNPTFAHFPYHRPHPALFPRPSPPKLK